MKRRMGSDQLSPLPTIFRRCREDMQDSSLAESFERLGTVDESRGGARSSSSKRVGGESRAGDDLVYPP